MKIIIELPGTDCQSYVVKEHEVSSAPQLSSEAMQFEALVQVY